MNTYLEDLYRVEYYCIDTGHLLEQHQSEGDEKWLEIASLHQFRERAVRRIPFDLKGLLMYFLDHAQFLGYIRVLAAQPLKRFSRHLRFSL